MRCFNCVMDEFNTRCHSTLQTRLWQSGYPKLAILLDCDHYKASNSQKTKCIKCSLTQTHESWPKHCLWDLLQESRNIQRGCNVVQKGNDAGLSIQKLEESQFLPARVSWTSQSSLAWFVSKHPKPLQLRTACNFTWDSWYPMKRQNRWMTCWFPSWISHICPIFTWFSWLSYIHLEWFWQPLGHLVTLQFTLVEFSGAASQRGSLSGRLSFCQLSIVKKNHQRWSFQQAACMEIAQK